MTADIRARVKEAIYREAAMAGSAGPNEADIDAVITEYEKHVCGCDTIRCEHCGACHLTFVYTTFGNRTVYRCRDCGRETYGRNP